MIAGLNPWLSMWSHPREVIRALAFNKPTYGIYFLSIIYTLQLFFFYANWWSLGIHSHHTLYLTLGIVLSPLIALLWLYSTGALFCLLGKVFRGIASMQQLCCAIAWSALPYSFTLVMWLFLIFASPQDAFIQGFGPYSSIFTNFITLIAKIWSLALLTQSIREVQRFSLSVSILNVAIIWLFSWILFFLSFAIIRLLVL